MTRLKKCIQFKSEQSSLINNLINILNLDEKNSITLHDLDTNEIKKKLIMDLLPDVKKYFSLSTVNAFRDPDSAKRPYLSIIKNVLRGVYEIVSKDDKSLGFLTIRYFFILIKKNPEVL